MFSKAAQVLLRALLVVTILDVTGGHWLALQAVAWSRMIVDYSRKAPIGQAIKETFDGEHPCDMCKGIEKARQSEKKQEAQQVVLKREFIWEFRCVLFSPSQRGCLRTVASPSLLFRNQSPAVPPPRSLLS